MPLFKIHAAYKPTAEIETFIGDKGGLFYSEDDTRLRISDGVTPGGIVISAGNIGSGDGIAGLTADEINEVLYLNSNWDLLPTDNDQQNLGSPEKRWKDIYVSGGTIHIGDNLTIGENSATGTLEIPSGAVMKNPDGTRNPIATIDVDSIDWQTVLAGIDLGLEYATTSYVDGKVREAAIDGVDLSAGAVSILSDLDDVGALNALDGAFLQYNAEAGEWEANVDIAGNIVTIQNNITTLETNVTSITERVTTVETNITNVTNVLDNLPLEDLTNVEAENPESGSLLQYNGRENKWQATNNIETTFGSLRLNGGAF